MSILYQILGELALQLSVVVKLGFGEVAEESDQCFKLYNTTVFKKWNPIGHLLGY